MSNIGLDLKKYKNLIQSNLELFFYTKGSNTWVQIINKQKSNNTGVMAIIKVVFDFHCL